MNSEWYQELSFAVTICDTEGIVLGMNEKAGDTFAKWGGKELIGKSLLDCHNPHSQQVIKDMIHDDKTNCYTIEKEGQKKLIYQCPWYENGIVKGLVEISIVLPPEMPHFVRG